MQTKEINQTRVAHEVAFLVRSTVQLQTNLLSNQIPARMVGDICSKLLLNSCVVVHEYRYCESNGALPQRASSTNSTAYLDTLAISLQSSLNQIAARVNSEAKPLKSSFQRERAVQIVEEEIQALQDVVLSIYSR